MNMGLFEYGVRYQINEYRYGGYTITFDSGGHHNVVSRLSLPEINVIISAIALYANEYRKIMNVLWDNRRDEVMCFREENTYDSYGIPIRRKAVRFLRWVIYWPEVLTRQELDAIHAGLVMKISELLLILAEWNSDYHTEHVISRLLYRGMVNHSSFDSQYLIPVLDKRTLRKLQRYINRQYIFGKIKNIHYV